MFKQTVNLTTFKQHAPKILEGLSVAASKEVIQLIQRGSAIKVILTQEHYFDLLEKIESYERKLGLLANEQNGYVPTKFSESDMIKSATAIQHEIDTDSGV
jgi:hypothetical protein